MSAPHYPAEPFVVLKRSQYVSDIQNAAQEGARLALEAVQGFEQQHTREGIMDLLGIADVRTFEARREAAAAAPIYEGKTPLWRLSQFRKA